MTRHYVPIACGLYSQYELAVMRRQSLRLVWRGARGIDRVERVTPIDLRTRKHAEYMIARNRLGHRRVLRLDRIKHAQIL